MATGVLKSLSFLADGNGFIQPSDYVNSRSLGVATAETMAIPNDATHVVFASTGNFYVDWAGVATIPTDLDNGTAAELNPTQRRIPGAGTGRTLSMISPAACIVTASFYRI